MLSFELLITKENIDKLLKNTDVNITDVASSLSKVAKNIDSTVTDIDKTILKIEGKVSPAMDKLNKTMGNAEEATSSLKDAIEKSAPKLPRLLNKGEDALNETNEVVRSLKQVWPISSYIEEPKDSLCGVIVMSEKHDSRYTMQDTGYGIKKSCIVHHASCIVSACCLFPAFYCLSAAVVLQPRLFHQSMPGQLEYNQNATKAAEKAITKSPGLLYGSPEDKSVSRKHRRE